MYARSTTVLGKRESIDAGIAHIRDVALPALRMDPAALDHAVDVYQTVSIPAMEELDGFCSASLLVERASGSAMSTATYDSREAMHRNREQADAVQSAGNQETGAEVRELCEFEVALAHLRVPEIA